MEGYFSRSAKKESSIVPSIAASQVAAKFVASNQETPAEESPQESSIPFDPRPLHVILTERKAAIDAAFDEYFKLKNRVAKIGQEDAEWYDSLEQAKAAKDKRIKDEESKELAKFRAQAQKQNTEEIVIIPKEPAKKKLKDEVLVKRKNESSVESDKKHQKIEQIISYASSDED